MVAATALCQSDRAAVPAREQVPTERCTDAASAALDQLFRMQRRTLLVYLRRHVVCDDAEDMLQEVFLRAAASRHLCDLRNPGGFLCQIAKSVIADAGRRTRSRVRTVPIDGETLPGYAGDQEDDLLLRGVEVELDGALAKLPARTRAVFCLSRFERRSYREIEAILGLSSSAVEYHMVKALAHLRVVLANHHQQL